MSKPKPTIADLIGKLKQECDAAGYQFESGKFYIYITHHGTKEEIYFTNKQSLKLAIEDLKRIFEKNDMAQEQREYQYDIETLKDACIIYECTGWVSAIDIVIINKFGVERTYQHNAQGITKACNEIVYGFWLEAPTKGDKYEKRETKS
jgi:hypothetical protein